MEALSLLRVRSVAIEAGLAVAQVHAEEGAGVRAEVCPRAETAASRCPSARPPAATTAAAERRAASGTRSPAAPPRRPRFRRAAGPIPDSTHASNPPHAPAVVAESAAAGGWWWRWQTTALSQAPAGGWGWGEAAYDSVTVWLRTGTTAGRFSRRFRAVHSAKPSHRTQ